jgi:hypothetical protein
MRALHSLLFPALPAVILCLAAAPAAKEYLTPKEIELIQDAQEIDRRVKILLDAAGLRLKEAEERLNGKESEPGDPLEFFSVEDMLEGYHQIIRSVMLNLDGAVQNPKTEPGRIGKALGNLKESGQKFEKSLAILKRMAEEKRREMLWNLADGALEITAGAREGAEEGLKKYKEEPKKKRKN